MGAVIIVAVGTAVGTVAAMVAWHYLRLALRKYLRKPE